MTEINLKAEKDNSAATANGSETLSSKFADYIHKHFQENRRCLKGIVL